MHPAVFREMLRRQPASLHGSATPHLDLTSGPLVRALQHGYSQRLYGRPGLVELDRIRLIWPELLPAEVRGSLRTRCTLPKGQDARCEQCGGPCRPFLWVQPPKNLLQTSAVWIHRPPQQLQANHSDGEWVEVTHCYYSSEGIKSSTPMWFQATPGTGISINIGRTLRLDAVGHWPTTDETHRYTEQLHKAIVKGRVPRHVNTSGCDGPGLSCMHDLRAYDSLQYPLRAHPSFGDERWTEIVMLNWPGEASFITARQNRLMCGRHPYLRPCSLEDEAVRMMGPGCIRSMAKHPAVVQVMRQSNCTDNLQVNAVAEGIADREVQRLRSAPDWRGADLLPTSQDVSQGGW
tara:strand:- start:1583 stop:2626 length:1044 start_codon:yes stop_codon:yes gene_type:complete